MEIYREWRYTYVYIVVKECLEADPQIQSFKKGITGRQRWCGAYKNLGA